MTRTPRYPYGDMVLFGSMAAVFGYALTGWLGALVGFVFVVLGVIVGKEWFDFPPERGGVQ